MTHVRVALVTLILVGCAPKPSAPPSTTPGPAPDQPVRLVGASSTGGPGPSTTRAAPGLLAPERAAVARPRAGADRPARRPARAAPGVTRAGPRARGGPTVKVLYVKTHLANLREGGGTGTKILRVLRQGTRLEVLEERQEWYRVRLEDGQEGWVAASVTAATAP